MPRQFVLECVIDLPTDPHEMSDVISKTKAPWQQLLDALRSSGVEFKDRSEIPVRRPKKELPGVLLSQSRPAEAAE